MFQKYALKINTILGIAASSISIYNFYEKRHYYQQQIARKESEINNLHSKISNNNALHHSAEQELEIHQKF